jgi:Protein of unknown function (DUF3575)
MKSNRVALRKNKLSLLVCGLLFLSLSARGDIEDALEESKTVNFSTNFVGLFFGSFGAGVDFKVADFLTVGPSGAYISRATDQNVTTMGSQWGIHGTWYLTDEAISSSWFIAPEISALRNQVSFRNGSATLHGLLFGVAGGYQWVISNGMSVSIGAGLSYDTLDHNPTLSNGIRVALEKPLQFAPGLAPLIQISLGYTL